MRLKQEEPSRGEPGVEEPRYDAETLKKVTAPAQELQGRHEQTFTAREIEEIGSEAGLGRAFLRRALAQLTGSPMAAQEASRPRKVSRAPSVRALAAKAALARAWWSAGWTLPIA